MKETILQYKLCFLLRNMFEEEEHRETSKIIINHIDNQIHLNINKIIEFHRSGHK